MSKSKKASLKNKRNKEIKLQTVTAQCQCGNCSNLYKIYTLLPNNELTLLKQDINNTLFYDNFHLDNYRIMESYSDGINNTITKYQIKQK